MSDLLRDQLATAEAQVETLKRRIAATGCAEAGHVWAFAGGKNAACDEDSCGCSVPVYQCSVCGDCDYGDNDEARDILRKCAEDAA